MSNHLQIPYYDAKNIKGSFDQDPLDFHTISGYCHHMEPVHFFLDTTILHRLSSIQVPDKEKR
jgi:hypothetical protein